MDTPAGDTPSGEVFKTPLPVKDKKQSKISQVYGTKRRRSKRGRIGRKEGKVGEASSETETGESTASDTGSYISNKKFRSDKEGELSQSGGEVNDRDKDQDIDNVEGVYDKEEKELIGMIKELVDEIKKARYTAAEVVQAFRESQDLDEEGKRVKTRAVQTDRHLRMAVTLARALELLTDNIKLREEMQWDDKSAQCSPAFLLRAKAEEERNEEDKKKQDRRKEKKESSKKTKGRIEEVGVKRTANEKKNLNRNKTDRDEDADNSSSEEEGGWQEINRKKRQEQKRKEREDRKRKQEEEANMKRGEEAKKKIRKAPLPPKTEAIMVKATSEKTFADLFKKLKTEAGDKMVGIQMVRRSRGGDLVIEMEKNSNCDAMEQTVRSALGKDFMVKKLSPKIALEIKDLDPTMEKEDVRHAVARSFDLGELAESEVEVKALRFSFGGTKTAIISVPAEVTNKLGEDTRIKIGFTKCRIGRAVNITRCFRCHALGHLSYECKESLNGKELCRRCGTEGHQINGCNATRCCILCIRQGIPAANAEHVAGAINCPQYRKFVLEANRRN